MGVVRDWRERGRDLDVKVVPAGSIYDQHVTAADDAAEEAIRDSLQRADPSTPVVADVAGADIERYRFWVIDPIDGTTNFIGGSSFVAVSVSLVVDGVPRVAAAGCPFTGEVFSAAEALGAFRQPGERLRLTERPRSEREVVIDPETPPVAQRALWEDVRRRIAGVSGGVVARASIALSMAYVAAGRFDGFVQLGGSPLQDFAAGTLLIHEAGGTASGLDGDVPWRSEVVIAGTPQTYDDLRAVLARDAER